MSPSRDGSDVRSSGLLSPRAGIITRLEPFVSDFLPRAMTAVSAVAARAETLPGVGSNLRRISGFGVGTTYEEASWAAVGETVETYGCMVSSAGATIQQATYREIEREAVHGEEFARPAHAEINLPYVPFDERSPRGWVKARDLLQQKDVWLPAQLVLWPYVPAFEGEFLAPWTSSGLAAHRSASDATLSALREIEERDAFTLRHHHRRPPAEIDVTGADDPVDEVVGSLTERRSATVRAWDLTLDLGQPVVLAGVFSDAPGRPPMSFGAACRQHRKDALRKAVLEAFQVSAVMAERGFTGPASPTPLPHVSYPEAHFEASCSPNYRDTLAWLLDSKSADRDALAASSGAGSLPDALAAVAARGLRVLAVDLTPPDLRELGWHVRRVLVPGAQPLTFGRMQLREGPRLRWLPVERGWRLRPALASELNPHPHPFA